MFVFLEEKLVVFEKCSKRVFGEESKNRLDGQIIPHYKALVSKHVSF